MFVFVLLEFVKDDDEFYLVRSSLILELTVLPTTVFLRLFFSSLLIQLVGFGNCASRSGKQKKVWLRVTWTVFMSN